MDTLFFKVASEGRLNVLQRLWQDFPPSKKEAERALDGALLKRRFDLLPFLFEKGVHPSSLMFSHLLDTDDAKVFEEMIKWTSNEENHWCEFAAVKPCIHILEVVCPHGCERCKKARKIE